MCQSTYSSQCGLERRSSPCLEVASSLEACCHLGPWRMTGTLTYRHARFSGAGAQALGLDGYTLYSVHPPGSSYYHDPLVRPHWPPLKEARGSSPLRAFCLWWCQKDVLPRVGLLQPLFVHAIGDQSSSTSRAHHKAIEGAFAAMPAAAWHKNDMKNSRPWPLLLTVTIISEGKAKEQLQSCKVSGAKEQY